MQIKCRNFYITLFIILVLILSAACSNDATSEDIYTSSEEDVEDTSYDDGESEGPLLYDQSEFISFLPDWDGTTPYCVVNGNMPDFSDEEIWTSTQESLDPLDSLGRCGTANSCIGVDGMPTESRGDISEIHPTGWHSDTYDFIEGGNLYNRCHLIAFMLSGDDVVDRNLITGTSYMNREGMLPFENQIDDYVKSTENHVVYRVTPCFSGSELVARGVHMQALSIEDSGDGLAFNVYCYNVQPGIVIDYMTGDNKAEEAADNDSGEEQESPVQTYVLNTNTHKFHYDWCDSVDQMKPKNKQVIEASREEVIAMGYEPCGNCLP